MSAVGRETKWNYTCISSGQPAERALAVRGRRALPAVAPCLAQKLKLGSQYFVQRLSWYTATVLCGQRGGLRDCDVPSAASSPCALLDDAGRSGQPRPAGLAAREFITQGAIDNGDTDLNRSFVSFIAVYNLTSVTET